MSPQHALAAMYVNEPAKCIVDRVKETLSPPKPKPESTNATSENVTWEKPQGFN